jgi:glycosyltransferase involved in cell wall biosynthesis
MKIAILIDTFLPYEGGGQIFVWETARRIVLKENVRVNIITRKLVVNKSKIEKNEEYLDGRLKITRLGFCGSWNNVISRIFFIFLAFFYLLPRDFDLIDAQAFISGIPGKLAAMIKRKPVILTVHGTVMETGKASFLEKFILISIKYDAQISAASNFLKFENVNKNISVVNPGVDTNFYKPDWSRREDDRILFVGRLQKIKGTEILLRCANKLEREPCKFVIVGDGEELGRIKKYLEGKNISNVKIMGELPEKEVLFEYQRASLFLLPSLSEGFPLTILEAMACGLPIIAADVGNVSTIVAAGVNGFIVKAGTVNSFVEKIKLIAHDKNLAQEMSVNNVLKAKQYSWDKTTDGIYRVYLNTISKNI